MEQIGTSSLWVEKYRPKTIKDFILPDNIRNLFNNCIKDKEIPNLLFASSAGRGKTSAALALCEEVGVDYLYINGSLETQIDIIRYKVCQYASTSSFSDYGKVVIIDECDRLSPNAQDGMKGLIEQTEANCHFILTTNNLSRIIEPIRSRQPLINFNFNQEHKKSLVIAYFKRLCWILDQEKIPYDKNVLAEFVQKMYPDFRRTLGELQTFCKMYNEVSPAILQIADINELVGFIQTKKFNEARKVIANIDSTMFYTEFYNKIDTLLQDQCKPNVIATLHKYAYEGSLSVAPEIALCACIIDLMMECKFK